MGQIKHKMGKVGGGVDISHKSKMSGKAKNLMSFPGGMPGPGEYGKAEGMPRIVGKGMAKFISGESVGMRKMGQHKAPPQYDDGPMKTKMDPKKDAKALKSLREIAAKKKKDKLDEKLKRGPSGKLYAKSVSREKRLSEMKSKGPNKTDPDKMVEVSGDKSKVSKKTTGMTSAEKKAEMKRRKEFKSKVNQAKRDSKKEESSQMRQVQKDKRANEKVQRQRKSEGKDFVKYKKGTSKDGGAKESVVVRKKLKK